MSLFCQKLPAQSGKNVTITNVKIKIYNESRVPDYLQLMNQIKEGVSARRQEINRLVSEVDNSSAVLHLEKTAVLKAFRQ